MENPPPMTLFEGVVLTLIFLAILSVVFAPSEGSDDESRF